jgi:hypothetical protein
MAIVAAMLMLLSGQALAGHDEDRGDYGSEGGGGYGWYGPRYGWYGPQYENHDWHSGEHHDFWGSQHNGRLTDGRPVPRAPV